MRKTIEFIEKLKITFDEFERREITKAYRNYYLSLDEKEQRQADSILNKFKDTSFQNIEIRLKEAECLLQKIEKENLKV